VKVNSAVPRRFIRRDQGSGIRDQGVVRGLMDKERRARTRFFVWPRQEVVAGSIILLYRSTMGRSQVAYNRKHGRGRGRVRESGKGEGSGNRRLNMKEKNEVKDDDAKEQQSTSGSMQHTYEPQDVEDLENPLLDMPSATSAAASGASLQDNKEEGVELFHAGQLDVSAMSKALSRLPLHEQWNIPVHLAATLYAGDDQGTSILASTLSLQYSSEKTDTPLTKQQPVTNNADPILSRRSEEDIAGSASNPITVSESDELGLTTGSISNPISDEPISKTGSDMSSLTGSTLPQPRSPSMGTGRVTMSATGATTFPDDAGSRRSSSTTGRPGLSARVNGTDTSPAVLSLPDDLQKISSLNSARQSSPSNMRRALLTGARSFPSDASSLPFSGAVQGKSTVTENVIASSSVESVLEEGQQIGLTTDTRKQPTSSMNISSNGGEVESAHVTIASTTSNMEEWGTAYAIASSSVTSISSQVRPKTELPTIFSKETNESDDLSDLLDSALKAQTFENNQSQEGEEEGLDEFFQI